MKKLQVSGEFYFYQWLWSVGEMRDQGCQLKEVNNQTQVEI